jgi:hypothetical protein
MLYRHLRGGNADLRLDRPLTWSEPNSRMCARGEAVVGNNTGRQLIVGMQICPGRPWAPAVYLRDGVDRRMAWRMDVRGTHINRSTDGREWRQQTHVNVWRDDLASDKHAEEPWFPVSHQDDDPSVGAGDYRVMFEEFCRGSGIISGDGYHWIEPPPLPRMSQTIDGDVP